MLIEFLFGMIKYFYLVIVIVGIDGNNNFYFFYYGLYGWCM